jgi:hypothetical protein
MLLACVITPGISTFPSGVHPEHVAGYVGKSGFVDARPLIDALTGLQRHLFGRDSAQTFIDRLDINCGFARRCAASR